MQIRATDGERIAFAIRQDRDAWETYDNRSVMTLGLLFALFATGFLAQLAAMA